MSGSLELFKFLTGETVRIRVADRILPEPARVGHFKSNNLKLDKGLHHPELGRLLISVNQLRKAGMSVHFDPDSCRIIDGRRSHVIREQGKLFVSDVEFRQDVFESELAEVQMSVEEKLKQHERCGHFWMHDLRVSDCPACRISKGQTAGHKTNRPEHLIPKRFLEQVDWDFTGPYPESEFGRTWLLSAMCAHTGWVENYPVQNRSECADMLDKFIRTVGPPDRVRSDNAAEFKGAKCQWRKVCGEQKPAVIVTFSCPYTPQQNGRIERFNRTQGDALRAVLHGTDPKLWCYASRYVAYVHNRIERKKGAKSPFEKRFGRAPSKRHWRRFGCLCYAKVC